MAETSLNTEGGNGGNPNGDGSHINIGQGVDAVKRGRGRPPGSLGKNKALNLGAEKEAVSRRGPDPDADASAKFIGTALVALVELGESFVHNSCTNRIEKKRPDKIAEFKELAIKFSLQEKDKELIGSSMEKIARRYDVLSRFGPEVVLGITLLQYMARQMALMKFVTAVTQDVKPRNPNIESEKPIN